MFLGAQSTPIHAPPQVLRMWDDWKKFYNTKQSPQMLKTVVCAEIVSNAQIWADNHGIPSNIFNVADHDQIQSSLSHFNAFGRYLSAVESGKYYLTLIDGHLAITAPAGMTPDEYSPDLWENLGILPVIWFVAVGAVVVCSSIAAYSYHDYNDTKRQQIELEQRLQEMDRQIIAQPESTRRDWIKFKQANKKVAQQAGVLGTIFGSDGAGKIGAAIGAGIFLLLAIFAGKKGSDYYQQQKRL